MGLKLFDASVRSRRQLFEMEYPSPQYSVLKYIMKVGHACIPLNSYASSRLVSCSRHVSDSYRQDPNARLRDRISQDAKAS